MHVRTLEGLHGDREFRTTYYEDGAFMRRELALAIKVVHEATLDMAFDPPRGANEAIRKNGEGWRRFS